MARIGKPLVILVILMAFARTAFAGMLTGELDKPEGSVEDQFIYTLAVQGSADGEPAFPEVPGLSIRQAGTSQSVSIINGRMSREVQYQYVIVAEKEGTYTIPPVVMKVDGKKEQTLPIEFRVVAAGTGPQGRADRPIFIERLVAKNKVYVGEAVPSSIRVYSRVRILGAQPDFRYPDGFQVKKIDGEKNYTKVVDGQEFNVTEINTILIPTKEGRFEVPAAGLEVRFIDSTKPRRSPRSLLEDFWGQQGNATEKNFRSAPTSLEVLPLPVAGRRGDFSGLVGEFSGRAELSTRAVKVGETATLTLTIAGKGATSGMADPELGLGDRAKIYKDKPQSEDNFDAEAGVLGQRVFKIAIVPTAPGELPLGTLKIQYFNTTVGQYQDMLIDLGNLSVTGSSAAPSPPPALAPPAQENKSVPAPAPPAEVKSLAQDLLEPHPVDRLLKKQTIQAVDGISAGVLLLGSLGFLAWGGRRAWIRRLGGQHEQRKRADRALKAASKQLQEARLLLDQKDIQAAVGLAQSSIRQYMGDKFSIKGSALTLRDLEQQLLQHGLSGPTVEEMRLVWQNLDQLRFAASAADQNRGLEALQKVNQLLQEVEQRCAH